jgi:hypothetical protein
MARVRVQPCPDVRAGRTRLSRGSRALRRASYTPPEPALFALLGTTFGGNGQTTFNLPDLRGRLALGFGQGAGLSSYNLGAAGGEEAHQLPTSEVPAHAHTLNANNNGQTNGTNIPSSTVLMGSGYGIEANNLKKTFTATLRRRLRWPRVRSAPPEEAARTKTGCRF